MNSKKGSLVTYTIIGAILIIIAGGILFLVYGKLPTNYDKEACRNSVILRSNAILQGKSALPDIYLLSCKTEKITVNEQDPELIKRTVANAMYDCWWMLGEGKINFFSESGWREAGVPGPGTAKAKCVICSVIKFDDKIKENPKQLDLARYLAENKIPLKNITYLEYFTNGDMTKLPSELEAEKLDTSQDQMVVYMSIKGTNLAQAIISVAGFGGGSFFAAGNILRFLGVGFKTAIKFAGWVGVAITIAEIAGQTITQATSARAAAVHCDGNTKGCNALIVADYDAENLNRICQEIQSIP